MLAVDTNILARWIMRDDEAQASMADTVMAGAIEITPTVLMELGWVLSTIGGMTRGQTADSLAAILSIGTAHIDRRAPLRWAIERYRQGGQLADLVHIACVDAGRAFATFDRGIARSVGRSSPVPVHTLGG
jgi:predicted nucleic-acid-binding protein